MNKMIIPPHPPQAIVWKEANGSSFSSFLLGIGEFLPITIRLLSFVVYEKGEELRQYADNQRLINVIIHLLEFLAEDDNGDLQYRKSLLRFSQRTDQFEILIDRISLDMRNSVSAIVLLYSRLIRLSRPGGGSRSNAWWQKFCPAHMRLWRPEVAGEEKCGSSWFVEELEMVGACVWIIWIWKWWRHSDLVNS